MSKETNEIRSNERGFNNNRTFPERAQTRVIIARLHPWQVLKVAFIFTVCAGVVAVALSGGLWSIAEAMGFITKVNSFIQPLTGGSGIRLEDYIDGSKIVAFTTLLAIVNCVIITSCATLGAFIYNLTANLLGGVEVTLEQE
jgi:hypothetical protein